MSGALALALKILGDARDQARYLRGQITDEPIEVHMVFSQEHLDAEIGAIEIAIARIELAMLDEGLPWTA